ncbi:protein cycle-like isoform X1 [Amphibalanus amphitrite]|uniref:protein cycle-like isoform X1 n=1 Tax=Amphibalanus amphitrite TaxID=1232801 RepID=UPI001C90BCC6|nr:protein cycle-like isoform X1 [Amphibalanus amphitrite]XP_043245898.1 protein cycle-like isoform X1 [Amphibalanus amphitrite]
MSENGSNSSDRSGTKRKLEDHHLFSRESDDDDDNLSIGSSSKYSRMSSDSGGSSSKKQNHSEIEKRRRDKMNCYISELSQLIPMCQSRKLDKLTVLRMTVQHMKMLRNSTPSAVEGQCKPAFVTDQDMKSLILQAADGFVFVVGCDRGRVLYVSKSVENVLDYTQDDLIGQSLFDILHPRDVGKVKEQLASSDLTARSQLIDSKTLLPIPTSVSSESNSLCPGSMRSFFCRMKCGQGGGGAAAMDESDTAAGQRRQRRFSAAGDKRFKIVHCAGYLKAWVPSSGDVEKEPDEEGCNLSCLVAIGRLYSQMVTAPFDAANTRPLEFFSRHTTDGKFLYADQRVTLALGYLPHELVGTSIYELCHPDDIARIAKTHRHCLQSPADETQVYKFRVKNNSFVTVRTKWKAFKNPWTKELEYISASNQIMNPSPSRPGGSRSSRDPVQDDLLRGFSPLNLDGSETGGSISGETAYKFDSISASKIGRRIADEVLDSSRRPSPSLTSASPASNVETLLENIRENSNSGRRAAEQPAAADGGDAGPRPRLGGGRRRRRVAGRPASPSPAAAAAACAARPERAAGPGRGGAESGGRGRAGGRGSHGRHHVTAGGGRRSRRTGRLHRTALAAALDGVEGGGRPSCAGDRGSVHSGPAAPAVSALVVAL